MRAPGVDTESDPAKVSCVLPIRGQITARDLEFRSPLFHDSIPFVLLWSEKSGCTVAVQWFFYQLGLFDEAKVYHGWIHSYENDVFKERPNYLEDCAAAINSGKPVYKIVRNPYTRAYSGYLETCRPFVRERPGHWATITRQHILEALLGSSDELGYTFSFRQYAEWLVRQPRKSVDVHLQQQHVKLETKLDVKILRLESEQDIYTTLSGVFGLPKLPPDHPILTSGHHHARSGAIPPDWNGLFDLGLPIDRPADFKIFYPEPQDIARTTVAPLLRRFYRADFEAYGYPA